MGMMLLLQMDHANSEAAGSPNPMSVSTPINIETASAGGSSEPAWSIASIRSPELAFPWHANVLIGHRLNSVPSTLVYSSWPQIQSAWRVLRNRYFRNSPLRLAIG